MLKEFDMDYTYGPVVGKYLWEYEVVSQARSFINKCVLCAGITRLERWERAKKFGLNPPEEVRELIERHSHDPAYTQW